MMCIVEFGFLQSEFVGVEQSAPHVVQLAFLSGMAARGEFRLFITYTAGTTSGYWHYIIILLLLYSFIAAENDVFISSTTINIPVVVPQENLLISDVEMVFRLDGIAQEANETFTLGFVLDPGTLGQNPTLRDTLSGTVVDANGNIARCFYWASSNSCIFSLQLLLSNYQSLNISIERAQMQ